MYYKRVNRGLAFTKPGLYSFGFILAVGMIAVATGINGLYIFLSAGLGGFIVSGLLSEKAMKSCDVWRATAGIVDAGDSFPLSFNLENDSPWFTVYAVQTHFFLEKPRRRLIARPLTAAVAAHTTGKLPPGSTLTCSATCFGLKRGRYTRLLAMQQTTFPFGLLEKFKYGEIEAGLVVAPALDRDFLEEVRALVRRQLAAAEADREFFSHRAYSRRDSLKYLDWKKSAGRQPEDWVVKVFKAKNADAPIIVDAAWSKARATRDEASYEAFLAKTRTACLAVVEAGREVRIDFGGGLVAVGYDAGRETLAEAPRFAGRHEPLKIAVGPTRPGADAKSAMRLVIDADGAAHWATGGAA